MFGVLGLPETLSPGVVFRRCGCLGVRIPGFRSLELGYGENRFRFRAAHFRVQILKGLMLRFGDTILGPRVLRFGVLRFRV